MSSTKGRLPPRVVFHQRSSFTEGHIPPINLVKKTQKYPSIFSPANISSFWKKKGDKSDLENDRGIFNVTKIRSIMDRMLYNDIYDTIDKNMSCSNIGARKNRSINDHLFVSNGIFNDILKNKNPDIDSRYMMLLSASTSLNM